jgi:hypothetical protein
MVGYLVRLMPVSTLRCPSFTPIPAGVDRQRPCRVVESVPPGFRESIPACRGPDSAELSHNLAFGSGRRVVAIQPRTDLRYCESVG